MPILEIAQFLELKEQQKPVLCLDHGTKTIGVAICDGSWMIASALTKIINKKFTSSANQILEIYSDRECEGILIGLPLNVEDGEENKKCQSIRQFGRNILKIRDVNICFYDERFTTIMADESLSHLNLSWDKKQSKIDQAAAAHILQGFLDSSSASS